MKQTKLKNEHYSVLKNILRVATIGVAIWALIMAYQNKQATEFLQNEQDNVIERLLFPDVVR